MNIIKKIYNIDTKNITSVVLAEYVEGKEPIDGNHKISYVKATGINPIAFDLIYVENKWYRWIPLNPETIKGEVVDIIVGTNAISLSF